MNKQELLENYTMEQLADKVIALEISIADMKNTEKIIKQYNSKQCECEKLEKRKPFTDKEIAEKWKKLSEELNDQGFEVIEENKRLKSELDRKETTINQIDDILNELFGVTHYVVGKPDEFKKVLKEKIEHSKTLADFLPTEPIEVATELINANYTRNKGELEKKIGKAFGNTSDTTIEQMYSVSELRQIAEHLLVYCNANGEGEV